MGNCLALQDRPVKVMKTDGKIIEYKAPIKVHQVLSQFTQHAISDELAVVKHLHPNAEMIQGKLYYLLPLPPVPQPRTTKKAKKTVRFSDDVVGLEEARQAATGVVRIKLVISKQELMTMLGKEGASVDENMISHVLQKDPNINQIGSIDTDDKISPKGWLPAVLESIPEVN